MNEDIEKLKDKLSKILENYEIDKKIGQLSVDSIYHMFPTEIKLVLDYIEQLQNNWNELKKYIDKNKLVLQNPQILDFYLKMQELENSKDE